MREAQLHLILVQEVLGDRALHRLPVLQLEGEALHLRRAPRNITNPILALHRPAVGDLNLEALDLLGELDAHGVSERLALIVDIANVQHLRIKIIYYPPFLDHTPTLMALEVSSTQKTQCIIYK